MEGLQDSNFVDVVDRYLEISNVYHQRLSGNLSERQERTQITDRYNKLLNLVEDVSIQKNESKINIISQQEAKGRSVVQTKEFLTITSRYKNTVLNRLENKSVELPTPRNLDKLKSILNLSSENYLSSFPTLGYAWDILTELASLTILPNSESIAARDMIHMHIVELKIHLAKVIKNVILAQPDHIVNFKGALSVQQIREIKKPTVFIEKIIEASISNDIQELINEIKYIIIQSPELIHHIDDVSISNILEYYERENNVFYDSYKDYSSLADAKRICDDFVIFGLKVAYISWFTLAKIDTQEEGQLRKNMLFCTRILLDEGRWNVCRNVAQCALEIGNELSKMPDRNFQGIEMIRTNLFFSRKKCGENIEDEIRAWETSGLHSIYSFLKCILLDKFTEAGEIAMLLLAKKDDNSPRDLCVQELKEWPILEDFRKSEIGQSIISPKK